MPKPVKPKATKKTINRVHMMELASAAALDIIDMGIANRVEVEYTEHDKVNNFWAIVKIDPGDSMSWERISLIVEYCQDNGYSVNFRMHFVPSTCTSAPYFEIFIPYSE